MLASQELYFPVTLRVSFPDRRLRRSRVCLSPPQGGWEDAVKTGKLGCEQQRGACTLLAAFPRGHFPLCWAQVLKNNPEDLCKKSSFPFSEHCGLIAALAGGVLRTVLTNHAGPLLGGALSKRFPSAV